MTIIIGAGITGLSLAWLLKKAGQEVMLYEAGARPGGNIRSEWQDGHLLEFGPNSLRMSDSLHAFLEQVGITDEIVQADAAAKKRFVLRDGKYAALPSGPLSFLFGRFFPWSAKRRIFSERNLKSTGPVHETADAFIRRRFGDFAADALLAPFVSGIYAGDSRKLISALAFPQLVAGERDHHSVIRGMFKLPRNTHKGIFSFRDGLQALSDRLAADLGHQLQLNTALKAIRPVEGGWELHLGRQQVFAPQVVLCIPARQLSGLLETIDAPLAQQFSSLNYPPVALVHRIFRKEDIGHPLDGFGALHSPHSDAFSLGTIFSSSVFPKRSPAGSVLLTTMVGGAVNPGRAILPHAELLAKVDADHRKFLKINAKPLKENVTLYAEAIPQYDTAAIGLEDAVSKWHARGLFLAGNWAKGISVPDCIQNARQLCEQLNRPTG